MSTIEEIELAFKELELEKKRLELEKQKLKLKKSKEYSTEYSKKCSKKCDHSSCTFYAQKDSLFCSLHSKPESKPKINQFTPQILQNINVSDTLFDLTSGIPVIVNYGSKERNSKKSQSDKHYVKRGEKTDYVVKSNGSADGKRIYKGKFGGEYYFANGKKQYLRK